MAFKVLDQETLERLVYEIQNSKLPIARVAAELIVLRELLAAIRASSAYRPKRVQQVLDRIPALNDKEAWYRMTQGEQEEAITDFMREDFE